MVIGVFDEIFDVSTDNDNQVEVRSACKEFRYDLSLCSHLHFVSDLLYAPMHFRSRPRSSTHEIPPPPPPQPSFTPSPTTTTRKKGYKNNGAATKLRQNMPFRHVYDLPDGTCCTPV